MSVVLEEPLEEGLLTQNCQARKGFPVDGIYPEM